MANFTDVKFNLFHYVFFIMMGVILIATGIGTIIYTAVNYKDYDVMVEVSQEDTNCFEDIERSRAGTRKVTKCNVIRTYNYKGKEYKSSTYHTTASNGEKEMMYINPNDPKEPEQYIYIWYLVGVLTFGLGVFCFYLGISIKKTIKERMAASAHLGSF